MRRKFLHPTKLNIGSCPPSSRSSSVSWGSLYGSGWRGNLSNSGFISLSRTKLDANRWANLWAIGPWSSVSLVIFERQEYLHHQSFKAKRHSSLSSFRDSRLDNCQPRLSDSDWDLVGSNWDDFLILSPENEVSFGSELISCAIPVSGHSSIVWFEETLRCRNLVNCESGSIKSTKISFTRST